MVRAWIAVLGVFAFASASAGCGNKQITQERTTVTDTDAATTTAADDPNETNDPSHHNDEDDSSDGGSTGGPDSSTSSPTDPSATTNASDTDTDTDVGSGSFGTDFTSGFTTGGDLFWCADHELGEAAVPVSYSGSNFGRTDAYLGSCTPGANGDEYLVTWTAPDAGTYYIDTIGSAIDTVLYVLDSCGGTELACSDDISMEVLQSSLQIDVCAGETILIVIDGYNSDASGAFELYISM